jgi:hypothetical protein
MEGPACGAGATPPIAGGGARRAARPFRGHGAALRLDSCWGAPAATLRVPQNPLCELVALLDDGAHVAGRRDVDGVGCIGLRAVGEAGRQIAG